MRLFVIPLLLATASCNAAPPVDPEFIIPCDVRQHAPDILRGSEAISHDVGLSFYGEVFDRESGAFQVILSDAQEGINVAFWGRAHVTIEWTTNAFAEFSREQHDNAGRAREMLRREIGRICREN